MAIELSTATNAQLSGINTYLRKSVFPIQGLPGSQNNTIVFDANSAAEGGSVPDGSTDDYTKTYNLGVELTNAVMIWYSNTGNDYSYNPFRNFLLDINAQFLTTTPVLSSQFSDTIANFNVLTNIQNTLGIYITQDYTTAMRLDTFSSSGAEKLESGSIRSTPNTSAAMFGKTYSQLQNTLVGYYGFTSNSSLFRGGAYDIKSVLKSAYLNGNNLVLLFKKYASTTSANLDGIRFGLVY
jgi:hypothetical protein